VSVDALRGRHVSSSNARLARHFQTIWLLAKGHGVAEVSRMTSFGPRWIEQLAARYNAEGPDSLGDLRRRNGTSATILKPELLDKLRERFPATAACGRARRSPSGWRKNSGSIKSARSAAGRP
jgi:transposase